MRGTVVLGCPTAALRRSSLAPSKIAFSFIGLLLLLCSCQAYDRDLLTRTDPSPTSGKGGDSGSSGAGAGNGSRAGTSGKPAADGDAATQIDSSTTDSGVEDAAPNDIDASEAGTSGTGGTAGAGSGGTAGAGSGGTAGAGSGGNVASCVPSTGVDCCPNDDNKTAPGLCGCGVVDVDSDLDGTADCDDSAPYGWRRRLTFDRTQVSGTLTNFPLLVRLTDAQLGTSAAASGNDIYFLAADQTTPLAYEIESFDASLGALVAWVGVPTLDTANDLVVYLAYGDGQSSRSNASSVWSDHRYVWHLAQDPSTSGAGGIRDSTGRANGTSHGGMSSAASVLGVAGKAIAFDGVDDRISFVNDLTGSGPSTMEAWVNQSAQANGLGSAILTLGNQASNSSRFFFSLEKSSGKSKVGFYNNDLVAVPLVPSVWTHFVWVWDGSVTRIFVNGALAFGPTAHASAYTAGTVGNIGNSTFTLPAYDFYMLGQLDEVRVSTVARPAAWITAEFNNQRMGSTFMKTIDAPVAAPQH